MRLRTYLQTFNCQNDIFIAKTRMGIERFEVHFRLISSSSWEFVKKLLPFGYKLAICSLVIQNHFYRSNTLMGAGFSFTYRSPSFLVILTGGDDGVWSKKVASIWLKVAKQEAYGYVVIATRGIVCVKNLMSLERFEVGIFFRHSQCLGIYFGIGFDGK